MERIRKLPEGGHRYMAATTAQVCGRNYLRATLFERPYGKEFNQAGNF